LTQPALNVDYFEFYSHVADGELRLALYDASLNLIWQSDAVINTVTADWIQVPVSPPITNLPAGDYYLAYQVNSKEPVASYIPGLPDEGLELAYAYGSFPSSLVGGVSSSSVWSYYGHVVIAAFVGGSTNNILKAPFNLTCESISSDTIRWEFEDSSYDETAFRLYGPAGLIKEIAATNETTRHYIDENGLTPGTLYDGRYVVVVRGDTESEPTLVASCKTFNGIRSLPAGINVGDIIKIPDITTVYLINADGRRQPFSSEPVYWTWYPDYKKLKIVTPADLAAIEIGPNMTVRPGSDLIKINSVDKVFAVEPIGVIRWIQDEQTAVKLYGANWNTRIIDISPVFFQDYEEGYPIDQTQHSSASLISYQGSSNIYYIDGGTKRLVTEEVFRQSHYQLKHIITGVSDSFNYSDGENLAVQTEVGYMR
jgi:hypothetical protein